MIPTRRTNSANGHPALAWIAAFKLVKAAALLLLGAYTLHLLQAGVLDRLVASMAELPLASGLRPLVHVVDWLAQLGPRRMALVGIALCGYALLYTVEGIGLWLHKRWAEFLTVIATASLIPFEMWELTRGFSITKVIALLINVVIVVYLVRVIRVDRNRSA